MADVHMTREALAQLQELREPIVSRVNQIIERLTRWPAVSGAKPLRGKLKGSRRIRTGSYRVVFTVAGDVVTITAIDNRRDVYED
jgi:mRNA interferase RelE/StbE